MLCQQLLQQRIRTAFINLRLGSTFRPQEIARVQPGRLHIQFVQYRRHQARRPDLAVTNHLGIDDVVELFVQQHGQTLQILNKLGDQGFSGFRR
ncbi:hypothetical protein D3C71_1704470 [compost metagenome]